MEGVTMPSKPSHLRIASRDGVKVRGIQPPREVVRSLPPFVISRAADAAKAAEIAAEVVQRMWHEAIAGDAIIARAIARGAPRNPARQNRRELRGRDPQRLEELGLTGL